MDLNTILVFGALVLLIVALFRFAAKIDHTKSDPIEHIEVKPDPVHQPAGAPAAPVVRKPSVPPAPVHHQADHRKYKGK